MRGTRPTGSKQTGYTIIEVLIFVAISGFMFVLAAAFINGKQASAEFRQGVNDINSQLQQVINDVSNGFYPSNSGFTCYSNTGILTITSPATGQGANAGNRGGVGGCVFLGKVVQFNADQDPLKYYVYTVAGSQFANGATDGNVPATFAEALPTAVDNASVNLTDKRKLQWGLKVIGMYDNSTSPAAPLSAVGFYGGFGSYSGASLQSGSQSTTVVALTNTVSAATGETEATMTSHIKTGTTDANARNNPQITICFQGRDNQYGKVVIGGGLGQRLTTTLRVSTVRPAECP